MQFTLDLDQQDSRTQLYFGWLIEAKKFSRTVTEAGAATAAQKKTESLNHWTHTARGDVWETWITNQRTGEHYKIQSAESLIKDPETALICTREYLDTFYTVEYCGQRIARVKQFDPLDRSQCELQPVSNTRHCAYSGLTLIYWFVALVKGQREAITTLSAKSEAEAWEAIRQMEADGWTA